MTGATNIEDVKGEAVPPYRNLDSGQTFPSLGVALYWLQTHRFEGLRPGQTSVRLTRKGHQDTILCKRADGTWYVQWLGRALKGGVGCAC